MIHSELTCLGQNVDEKGTLKLSFCSDPLGDNPQWVETEPGPFELRSSAGWYYLKMYQPGLASLHQSALKIVVISDYKNTFGSFLVGGGSNVALAKFVPGDMPDPFVGWTPAIMLDLAYQITSDFTKCIVDKTVKEQYIPQKIKDDAEIFSCILNTEVKTKVDENFCEVNFWFNTKKSGAHDLSNTDHSLLYYSLVIKSQEHGFPTTIVCTKYVISGKLGVPFPRKALTIYQFDGAVKSSDDQTNENEHSFRIATYDSNAVTDVSDSRLGPIPQLYTLNAGEEAPFANARYSLIMAQQATDAAIQKSDKNKRQAVAVVGLLLAFVPIVILFSRKARSKSK